MTSFANVSYTKWKEECRLLAEMHFLEIIAHRGGSLAMDDEFYEELDENGMLRTIVAYDDNDVPIGYIMNVVHHDPHDENQQQISLDLVYVTPAARKEHVGITLYKLAEADLLTIAPGARWLTSVPVDGASEGKQRTGLTKFGFKAVERIYMKTLEAEQ